MTNTALYLILIIMILAGALAMRARRHAWVRNLVVEAEETIGPRQKEVIDRAIAALEAFIRRIVRTEENTHAVLQYLREWFPGGSPSDVLDRDYFLKGAIFLGVVDLLVQYGTVMLQFDVQPAEAAIISVGFVLLAVGLAFLIAVFLFYFRRHRPRQAVRWLVQVGFASTITATAALAVLLFARFATVSVASTMKETLAIGVFVLAEAGAVAAGALAMAHHFLANQDRYESRLQQIAREKVEAERGLDELRALLTKVALFLVLCAALSGELTAQRLPPSGCVEAVDGTRSIDAESRDEGLGLLARSVDDMVDAFGCRRLMTTTWGSDTLWLRLRYHDVPQSPRIDDCDTVRAATARGIDRAITHVRAFQEAAVEAARAECNARTNKLRLAFDAARRQWRAEVTRGRTVRLPPDEERQTAFAAMLRYLTGPQRGYRLAVVASDAIETVLADSMIPQIEIPQEMTLVIVLLKTTPAARAADPDATKRAVALWVKRVPGIVIVQLGELAEPGFWAKLADASSGRPAAGNRCVPPHAVSQSAVSPRCGTIANATPGGAPR